MREILKASLLAVAIAAVLPACKQSESGPTKATNQSEAGSGRSGSVASSAKPEDADGAWMEKVNKYISVANSLRSFNQRGITEASERWRQEAIEKARKGDFTKIRTNSHLFENNVDDLQAVLAMPAATPAADAAAKQLLEAVQKYLPNWKALEAYNKSRKFEDDAGAEGKRMLTEYLTGIDAIESALATFNAEVDGLSKQMQEKNAAKFAAEGKMLELHTLNALGAGEKILGVFESEDDFKNPAKIEQANGYLAEMEKAIEGIRAEHAKRKAADQAVTDRSQRTLPMSDQYNSIASNLERMAGTYREARKNPQRFNDAVRNYNGAVDSYNRMR